MKISIKTFFIFLALIFAFSALSGCSPLISETDQKEDTPLFPNDTSEVQPKEFMLYFQLEGENYIVPETRTLTIPESKSVEEVLIKELLSGPESNSTNIAGNINSETKIISIIGNENILFVSLSKQFLTPPEGLGAEIEDPDEYNSLVLNARKMALYSITNTVTELGNYSYVQFYIDYDNNGTGTRPTRKDMGFTGEGENQLLEPLYRNTEVVFSPANSLKNIMNSIIEKNWTKILKFTSISDKPDTKLEDAARQFELSNLSLLEYSILSSTVSLDGKSAVIVLNYTFANADGTSTTVENLSIKMYIEDGIWKCSIVSLNQMLLGEYS
ncbi:MAG: GerMN domain-containing protein [Clostridia bacterium]|nr:GerMN domain-containing protein [Clostridia bacterium]